MENQTFDYLPQIKDCLKMAAHWAMILTVIIALRLLMTIYYVYTYYSSFNGNLGSDIHTYTYLGNSLVDIILSTLSAIFLYKFAQYAYQDCRNDNSLDGVGLFANFRNYLILGIILSLNWLVYGLMNLLRGFMY